MAAAHGALHLFELMRFTDPVEGAASLALRDGHTEALGFYLDHDRVHVRGLDAVDGTPVLDIKPHMEAFAARGEVHEPAWAGEARADEETRFLRETGFLWAKLYHHGCSLAFPLCIGDTPNRILASAFLSNRV